LENMTDKEPEGINRRDFLKGVGAGVIGGGLVVAGVFTGTRTGIVSEAGTGKPRAAAVSASEGYLLVDTTKCANCQSCMMACSLVHEGKQNASLSRIQILFNSFENFPDDLKQSQCRQCVYPVCVSACPTGALSFDDEAGVRTVDKDLCIGCQRCVEACPFTPGNITWNFEEGYAQKCDLCADTPFWNEIGGVDGKQACVAICPMQAIKFTTEIPAQVGDMGYNVNLRGANSIYLGLPTD
jgi:protein NrfC